MRNATIKLFIAGVILSLASCGPTPIYEKYVAIDDHQWNADNKVSFEIDIEDTSAVYQAILHLRNNDDYEYSNIYLFRDVQSDRGTEFADTAMFILADNYGKWLGKGVGELKTNSWPFKNGLLRFRHPGKYIFTMQQAMRTEDLNGVEDVGLGIYKLDPKDGE